MDHISQPDDSGSSAPTVRDDTGVECSYAEGMLPRQEFMSGGIDANPTDQCVLLRRERDRAIDILQAVYSHLNSCSVKVPFPELCNLPSQISAMFTEDHSEKVPQYNERDRAIDILRDMRLLRGQLDNLQMRLAAIVDTMPKKVK